MSENGLLNDYQAVIDFWSELDSNYTELADSFSYVVEGTVVGMPLDLTLFYDESEFSKLSFVWSSHFHLLRIANQCVLYSRIVRFLIISYALMKTSNYL